MQLQAEVNDKQPRKPDPSFFMKDQVSTGTVFTYMGALDPGTQWEVLRIVTTIPAKPTKTNKLTWKLEDTDVVRKLSDDIYLRSLATGEVRSFLFGYLSYSAIWQISRKRR